jgi:UPF0271 protein
MERKALVLDTSAFIAGFDPNNVTEKVYTVPDVGQELSSNSLSYTRFKAAIEIGKLHLRVPAQASLGRVKEFSKIVGDVLFLSSVDLQVLALAFELKNAGEDPLIVTDDYSIQNVANQIGVQFAPLMTFGIRYRLDWIMYCPACYRKYPTDYKNKSCEVCGTKLKRKSLRKTLV